MRATPYARATSGGSAVPADEAERERAIRADWISADGGFANDAFIKSLLSSAAPKLLHEQLRKANYNTREGEGKASSLSRPKAELTSKNHKSSKTTISEEVVREHFPKALPLGALVTPGLVNFLVDEMHFTPRQTLHAHASCANDTPLRLASDHAVCFLGKHVALSGVAGIPLNNSCRVMAQRASLYGCKVVITYQSHCSVSANGTFDYIELADQHTDLRIESQCCEPVIRELNQFIHFGPRQSSGGKKEGDTAGGGGSARDEGKDAARERDMIRAILSKHQERLKHTASPPLVELPRIMYEEIRDRLIRAVVPYLEVPALLIGGIHIHTPPDIEDYFHVIDVDYLRSLSMRKQGSKKEQEEDARRRAAQEAKDNDGERIPTPRSVYSDEEEEEDDDDGSGSGSESQHGGNAKEDDAVDDAADRIWANPHGELLSRKREFYASMKQRIVARQAGLRGGSAVEEAMQMRQDREWKDKVKAGREGSKRAEDQAKRDDDWGFKEGEEGGAEGGLTAAAAKVTKWFRAFRWSRLVRRMMEEIRRSEIAEEWNLDEEDLAGGGSQQLQKKKMGAFFMTLRWNRLVKLVLSKHALKERRERLHFY
jgi:hypothetical protein